MSRVARQAETGLAAHLAVPVEQLVTRPVWDWAAANERKKDAVAALAPRTVILDDIDDEIDELAAHQYTCDRPTGASPSRLVS